MFRSSGIVAMRYRRNGSVGAVALIATLIAYAVTISPAESYDKRGEAVGIVARSLSVITTAHLHLVRAEGSQLFEEGSVSGALPGWMRAELKTGAIFTGKFTTRAHGGTINGRGRATPHGSGRYQSFSGSFVVTGGSGHYAHVSGRAGLYGVFDRRTDSVTVQTTGKLSY